jgi:hypothetical protein
MDTRAALAQLDLPRGDGYYRSRIPSAYDSRIGRVIAGFTAASPVVQAAFRESLDADRADLLRVWSERLAALAVRLDSSEPLVQGLVGLSVAQEDGGSEAMLVAPLHRRSAEKLGLDPERIFDAAAGRTDLAGARWLREVRDLQERPEDAGYVEDADADGFRYLRSGSGIRPGR